MNILLFKKVSNYAFLFIYYLLSIASAAVLESIGTYKISLVRHGNMDEVIKVR